jgi:hypothetical protein
VITARVLRLFAAASAVASLAASAADVQLCTSAAGSPLYTQFGCPAGTEPSHRAPDGVLSIVAGPGLSKSERQALERLETSLDRQRSSRRQANERRARARQDDRAMALERCAEARARLATLQSERRRGYTAMEDGRLTAEEAHWRQVRRSSC